jgi:hypothetical protein
VFELSRGRRKAASRAQAAATLHRSTADQLSACIDGDCRAAPVQGKNSVNSWNRPDFKQLHELYCTGSEMVVVRSYHQEYRRSHQNSQLGPVWAGLVLG